MIRRYLLDTGPAHDFIFERRDVAQRIEEVRKKGIKVGIGLPTLGELVAGIENSDKRSKYLPIAKRRIELLVYWPFDKSAAYEYGKIYAKLRSIGVIIQQIDMQIAAIAFAMKKCKVITYDSDLQAVPGLDVENWL